jgi:hypothetical protein
LPGRVVNIFVTGILFILTLLKFIQQLRDIYEETPHVKDLIAGCTSTGILGMFLRDTTFYMLW